MDKKFVRILSNIDCRWEGLPPVYRLYVNNELFSERTYVWRDSTVQEIIQVEAQPGDYHIRYELVGPHLADLRINDLEVQLGSAIAVNPTQFRIV